MTDKPVPASPQPPKPVCGVCGSDQLERQSARGKAWLRCWNCDATGEGVDADTGSPQPPGASALAAKQSGDSERATPPAGSAVLSFKPDNVPTAPGWYMAIAPERAMPNLYEISIVSGRLHARKVWSTTGSWVAGMGASLLWTDRLTIEMPPEAKAKCPHLFRV